MSSGAQRAADERPDADLPASQGQETVGGPTSSSPSPAIDHWERDFEQRLPATAVACTLRLTPAAIMSAAVLTGLGMLAREGRIRLDVEIAPEAPSLEHGPWHLRDKQRPQTVLELEGGGSAVIDGHDSWEIETQDLLRHDLYFKRSLRPESVLMPRGERRRSAPIARPSIASASSASVPCGGRSAPASMVAFAPGSSRDATRPT